jgi:hypothetical protein
MVPSGCPIRTANTFWLLPRLWAAPALSSPTISATSRSPRFPRISKSCPPKFAADPVSVSPDMALRAVQIMAARYAAPPLTADEFLNHLAQRYKMSEATELISAVN